MRHWDAVFKLDMGSTLVEPLPDVLIKREYFLYCLDLLGAYHCERYLEESSKTKPFSSCWEMCCVPPDANTQPNTD